MVLNLQNVSLDSQRKKKPRQRRNGPVHPTHHQVRYGQEVLNAGMKKMRKLVETQVLEIKPDSKVVWWFDGLILTPAERFQFRKHSVKFPPLDSMARCNFPEPTPIDCVEHAWDSWFYEWQKSSAFYKEYIGVGVSNALLLKRIPNLLAWQDSFAQKASQCKFEQIVCPKDYLRLCPHGTGDQIWGCKMALREFPVPTYLTSAVRKKIR